MIMNPSDNRGEWLFGHFGYAYGEGPWVFREGDKNDGLRADGFSKVGFFVPEIVLEVREGTLAITCQRDEQERILSDMSLRNEVDGRAESHPDKREIVVRPRTSRQRYMETVGRLLDHIAKGDCFEINYCQEFFAENVSIDPLVVYRSLMLGSPMPFSAFYRIGNSYAISASPERYLEKRGDRLLSQPMKGTAKRSGYGPVSDEMERRELSASLKERAENVMVVDLVRNDLSRVCSPGSVKTEKLFETITYSKVHQMITSVKGTVRSGNGLEDIVKASFPMGSMTGAPKRKVMELIHRYEDFRRGLYSGAIGYISPEQDFDFNVAIRTIFHNRTTGYVSLPVGSGITCYCDPEKEYEECLLKLSAMQKALTGNG